MQLDDSPVRRTVDFGAATGAALIAGLVALLMYLFFVPAAVGAGSATVVMHFLASVLLGPESLASPGRLTPAVVGAGLLVHFAIAALMTLLIAFVLHRWGLIVGVFGGAMLGLALYGVNYYLLSSVFEQFHAMAHWSVALVHVVFGAVSGGVYELLEYDPPETAVRGQA